MPQPAAGRLRALLRALRRRRSTRRRRSSSTIGAKEGLAHLMWVLRRGRRHASSCRRPSYPIHLRRARAWPARRVVDARLADGRRRRRSPRRFAPPAAPKVVIVSFPHNPTTAVATRRADMQQLVDLAREREFLLVHDFAYADIAFDGHRPPSVLAAEGAARLRGRALQPDQVVLDGRLARGLHARPPGRRRRAGEAEVLPRLRHLPADPDRLDRRAARGSDYPAEVCEIYRRRRDALCRGLDRAGWHVEPPHGTMFVWAPIPERFRELGSLEFALLLAREATSRSARASASATAATGTSASRSSRTSSGSARRPASIRKLLER